MNPIAPPPLTAINDAIAIVRLIQNPEQAAQLIEALKMQADRHAETLQGIIGRSDQLDAKERDLQARESALAAQNATIGDREAAIEAREKKHAAEVLGLQQSLRTLDSQTSEAHARIDAQIAKWLSDRNALDSMRLNFEQTSASRSADLDRREAALGAGETRLATKLKVLND